VVRTGSELEGHVQQEMEPVRDSEDKVTELKKSERSIAASRRNSLAAGERKLSSELASQAAIDWLILRRASSFMAYTAFRSELDTRLLLEWGWSNGLTVIIPRTIPEKKLMELYCIEGWESLSPGSYGLLEPDPLKAARFELDERLPDTVFVPGLAFDNEGGRLGYGGGYYDRFRDRIAAVAARQSVPVPPWIGMGFNIQWVEQVPMESHDARLNGVITESGLKWVSDAASS